MKNKKILIGGIIIFLAIVYLGYTGFIASATYYYTVSEFLTLETLTYDENIRISGDIAPGSIQKEDGSFAISFTVTEDGYELPVFYRGVVPDSFEEGGEAVVEGYLDSAGVFQANIVLVKCPSKYDAEVEENQ